MGSTVRAVDVLKWAESKPAGEVVWKEGDDPVTACVTALCLRETTDAVWEAYIGSARKRENGELTDEIEFDIPLMLSVTDFCQMNTQGDVTAGMVVNTISERI